MSIVSNNSPIIYKSNEFLESEKITEQSKTKSKKNKKQG
jgi:hypothetical protein